MTIAYLYYDFLNLYGENGNVKFLKNILESIGIKVTVKLLSIHDELCFKDYDLVYIGAGTEDNQIIVLNHLINYKKDIKKFIDSNKFFLATGNSLDLFGKSVSINNTRYDGLNIFKYTSTTSSKRLVDEAIFKFQDDFILGFQNQSNYIKDLSHSLFEVKKGIGSYIGSFKEGIHYKNFYGTYLLGPILIRNPKFAYHFISKLVNRDNLELNLRLEQLAHDDYIETFYKEKIEELN